MNWDLEKKDNFMTISQSPSINDQGFIAEQQKTHNEQFSSHYYCL